MILAIPIYVYVNVNSLQEAQTHKKELEKLLNEPLIKTIMQQKRIPEQGFVVGDPMTTQQR